MPLLLAFCTRGRSVGHSYHDPFCVSQVLLYCDLITACKSRYTRALSYFFVSATMFTREQHGCAAVFSPRCSCCSIRTDNFSSAGMLYIIS
jgi:hypothetical protein